IQAVAPLMRGQGGGTNVNVSSGTTRRLPVGIGPYAATKAALNTVTDVARAELADDGIAVSLVIPSITATEFHSVLRAGAAHIDGLPKSPPSDVAEAILRAIETAEPEISVWPKGSRPR
ncbi:MAG: SDR family NAD(P)-dependent oxidoreductase, partial [Acidimicrobiales bacterium]